VPAFPRCGTVPVNQGRCLEALSTHNVRIAFGNGCDHLGYVAAKCNGGFISCNMGLSGGDWTNTAVYSYLANSPLVGNIGFQHNGQTVMTTTKNYDYLNRLTAIHQRDAGPNQNPVASFDYMEGVRP